MNFFGVPTGIRTPVTTVKGYSRPIRVSPRKASIVSNLARIHTHSQSHSYTFVHDDATGAHA
jgi:hypothetical protein